MLCGPPVNNSARFVVALGSNVTGRAVGKGLLNTHKTQSFGSSYQLDPTTFPPGIDNACIHTTTFPPGIDNACIQQQLTHSKSAGGAFEEEYEEAAPPKKELFYTTCI